ncbi:hypothetical protein MNB_SM-6-287 [hydrothermal vent metagenome]|uniref:Uncharacterized protein n=1 Tax=hydrothermal vent metagenome TaxID=652676 RepID=A0A1W1CW54_9ZZZZ
MPSWVKFLFYLTLRIVITFAVLGFFIFLLWWLLYSIFY